MNYIGTKKIIAEPMTRLEYNQYRGWDVPSDENPEDEGYLVEYEPTDPPTPNTKDREGYVSWSPKEVFEEAYSPEGSIDAVNRIMDRAEENAYKYAGSLELGDDREIAFDVYTNILLARRV